MKDHQQKEKLMDRGMSTYEEIQNKKGNVNLPGLKV